MWVLTEFRDSLEAASWYFLDLAIRGDDFPYIGNWWGDRGRDLSRWFMDFSIRVSQFNNEIEALRTDLYARVTWDQARANILGVWSWLNTIDDKIWWRAYSMVTSYWSWLNTAPDTIWSWMYPRITSWWPWVNSIDDKIWSVASSRILGAWSFLNTIDDRIWSTAWARILGTWPWINSIDDRIRSVVSAQWTALNSIDDRIRDIAWSHIQPKLADWFWSFIVLEVTLVSKIGYRVISTLWNMQWDDKNKEAR